MPEIAIAEMRGTVGGQPYDYTFYADEPLEVALTQIKTVVDAAYDYARHAGDLDANFIREIVDFRFEFELNHHNLQHELQGLDDSTCKGAIIAAERRHLEAQKTLCEETATFIERHVQGLPMLTRLRHLLAANGLRQMANRIII